MHTMGHVLGSPGYATDFTSQYVPHVDDVSIVTDADRATLSAGDTYPSN